MDTKEHSFWDIISDYSIEIPAIQRDYAQGRRTERKIAKSLINDISSALQEEGKKINLHFIYGKTDNSKDLIPLDGQQRLTTLFLLHWFLSIGFLSNEEKNILSKFSYEARPSSKDFCLKLIKEGINKYEGKLISEQIRNSRWFFLSWMNDSTISAMLNMLDIIQEEFEKPDNILFKKLISDNCPIRFHFLPLNDFKLDDKIYVKMNARGKPLTKFENFKANFSGLLDIENKSKLDNDWLDIFWSLERDKSQVNINTNEVDRKYLIFLENVTFNFYAEMKDVNLEEKNNFDIFEKYKEIYTALNPESLNQLSRVLDSLVSFIDSDKYFENFLKSNLDYNERLQFYAIMLFFIKKGKVSEFSEIYEKWIRVCINLINNSRIEDPLSFCKAIRSIKKISDNIDNLYEYLANTEDSKIEAFLSKQWEEEKIKAKLLLQDKDEWKIEIYKIEKHYYFNGQIGFILEFARENEEYSIELFADYSAKLAELFGDNFKDNKDCLFQRALLTFGDYLVYCTGKTFCTFNENLREKMDNWRSFFNNKDKVIFLKNLLDTIHIDSIEHDLLNIITNYSENDWKSLFIKNNSIMKSCSDYKYRIETSKYKTKLCRSKAPNWRKYAELYSYALYETKIKGCKFLPFQGDHYQNSKDYDTAHAVIGEYYSNGNRFILGVEYQFNYFLLIFYNRTFDGEIKKIPDEIQESLNELNFTESGNTREYKIEEYDLDKVKEIICEKIKEMQKFFITLSSTNP